MQTPELVDLTQEQARFILDCIGFARDTGVLRAVKDSDRLTYEVSAELAPVANRGVE